MKSTVVWLMAVAAVVGAAGYIINGYSERGAEQEYRCRLNELKRDFAAATQVLAYIDDKAYTAEVGLHLAHYFSALARLREEFPQQLDVEAQREWVSGQVESGAMSASKKLQYDERIDASLELYAQMESGHYKPLFTAAEKGFRFDIVEIKAVQRGPRKEIRLAYVHWGPYGVRSAGQEALVSYTGIRGEFTALPGKRPAAAIPHFESDPGHEAPHLQINPERWVREFPPGVEIGYYSLNAMRAAAASLKLTFDFGWRNLGGSEVPLRIVFDAIPIQEQWRTAP